MTAAAVLFLALQLEVRIRYEGEVPAPLEADCLGRKISIPRAEVDDTRGLRDVVAELRTLDGKPALRNASVRAGAAEVRIQRDTYDARVLFVPAGGTLKITNTSGEMDNVHGVTKSNPEFNVCLTQGTSYEAKGLKPERFKITSDIYPFRCAWIVVTENDARGATDKAGAAKLETPAKGTYWLTLWHPHFGERKVPVDLPRDGAVEITYTEKGIDPAYFIDRAVRRAPGLTDEERARLEKLAEPIRRDDPAARDEAERALLKEGAKAAAVLAPMLKDGDLETQGRAKRIVAAIGAEP